MPSAATSSELSSADQAALLDLARDTIACGTDQAPPPLPAVEELPPPLQQPRATFVTLHKQGALRGCCGSLKAFESLARNVVRSANTAAFHDHRFSPVSADEVPDLDLHISILSEPTPLTFVTEADLVGQLRPPIDGVILVDTDLRRQGVFLPQVWEQIPDPQQFVRRLKRKAGLPEDYWSPWLEAKRFTVQLIGEKVEH